MAEIKGQITINEVSIVEISGDPSISGGTVLPIGSLALDDTGKLWIKKGSLDTDWEVAGSGGSLVNYQIDGGTAAAIYGSTTAVDGGGA